MALKCFKCAAEVVFDSEHIGKNGKKIPLDPFTKQPHDCPMREKRDEYSFGSRPIEDKNDHGNEELPALIKQGHEFLDKPYVDHTVARPSKVKIFHSENSDLVEIAYNEFLQSKTFQWTRAQLGAKGNEFAIALYYEEVSQ